MEAGGSEVSLDFVFSSEVRLSKERKERGRRRKGRRRNEEEERIKMGDRKRERGGEAGREGRGESRVGAKFLHCYCLWPSLVGPVCVLEGREEVCRQWKLLDFLMSQKRFTTKLSGKQAEWMIMR